jgi:hypothetical protein
LRIVVRCQDARLARDTQARLAAAGIEALAMAGPAREAPQGQDVIITLAPNGDLAAALDADASALALIAAAPWAHPPKAGLDGAGSACNVAALDAPPALLAAQIDSMIRIAVIEEERGRRRLTAHDMSIDTPRPSRHVLSAHARATGTPGWGRRYRAP